MKEEPAIETSEGFHAPFRARQYFGRQWVQYEGFYSGHLLFSGVGDDSYIPIGDVWKWHGAEVNEAFQPAAPRSDA